ncbi:MAG TPA: hypothetical protein DIV86_03550 [Alphaproteobacteria bacterium]|nr:hypothetical protein [Alphaproteobacteria bacterium]
MPIKNYNIDGFFDELLLSAGNPRPFSRSLVDEISAISHEELTNRQKAAEALLMQLGVTFTVYSDSRSTEKIMPFDIIPRIVPSNDWEYIEKGLKQRITALNMFVADIYGAKKIFKDKIVPEALIFDTEFYLPVLDGFRPPKDIWIHISGIDLIRDKDGSFYVLEDNLRCPSGISYVLENRNALKKTFPSIFHNLPIRPVSNYPGKLFDGLKYLADENNHEPNICVLTPGIFNSAYFEHSYLAQQMGVDLVEGRDLVVENKILYMKTTKGLKKVDVIYRRIDDEFLDPKYFNKNSLLGVPGIMDAYLAGNVALVNAPGVGVADDKAVYHYVPEIIKYYLGEEAILKNVPTYQCWKEDERKYVLDNIDKLVVKATNLSGGYGLIIGPKATKAELDEFKAKIKANPRNYIGQPVISLSTVPTITDEGLQARHVDLRPYIVYGKDIFILNGGLTRVALKKGSLVVNSSQGGGSKDTWVLSQ